MTDLTITSASLPERMEYARAISASSLLPEAFRQQPANALVAIEYGNALGIAPIVALSEINVIKGTPSLSASMMAALARDAGHKVRVTGDDESATCIIVRADDPGHEHTATWTKKKSQDAGLWGRGHWAKDAGTMLRWRAISECVRFACSEVLGGLKYTPDEIGDTDPAITPAESSRSGNAQLANAVAQHSTAAVVDQPTSAPELVDSSQWEEVLDPPQHDEATTEEGRRARGRMFALLTERGIDDPDEQRRGMSQILGRAVESRASLTVDDMRQIITSLEALGESA